MTHRTLIILIMLPILLSVCIPESPVIAASHPPYRLTQIHSTSEPKFLLKAADRLYFKPDGETNYWVTDGLPENTHAISGASFCTLSHWSQHHDGHPTAIGNVAYFPGPDCELWRTDGTANGTFRLSQGAFPLNYVDSGIVGETAFGNKLVFLTGDDIFVEWSQYSLWGSDGTPAGTKKIASLNETGASMKYISPVALQDKVYFFTIHSSNTDSNIRWVKFWQSDGTENGTKVIIDSRTFTDFTGMPEKLVASSSHVFFTSRNADYSQDLWQSDGTLPGTEMVAPIGFGEVTDMVDADGTVFMINRKYSDQTGTLYITRGKELGGLQTVYVFPQPLSSPGSLLVTSVGARIFFSNRTGDGSPTRLWVSDGTQSGTHPILVNNGLVFPGPQLISLGDVVAFVGFYEHNDLEDIWFSDGTVAGSYQATNLSTGYDTFPGEMMFISGKLYFSFKDGQNGYDLWVFNYQPVSVFLPLVSH